MWKAVAASTVFVLLAVGSRAMGDIVQDQSTIIGTANGIILQHDDASANSSQNLIVSVIQDGSGIGSLLGSSTQLTGIGSQVGWLSGLSTMTDIGQTLMHSGLVSAWTLHSLGDQARLHALMLSAN